MKEESIVEDETETSIVKDDDRQAQPPNEQEDNEGEMSCTLFRACDRCTETESLTVPECQMGTASGTTGRIVTFRCTIITHNNNNHNDRATRSYIEHRKDDTYYYSHGSSISDRSPIATLSSSSSSSSSSSNFTLYHYESCRTTQNESEFNYIQFQVFICLIGLVSIYSIRKQKMLAASLFDQRRMTTTTSTAVSTVASSTAVSRTNSNASHSRVIQRSNTGVNSSSGNSNNDGLEMKPLLLASGSSNMSDMDIV
jgi:hypothetical protein